MFERHCSVEASVGGNIVSLLILMIYELVILDDDNQNYVDFNIYSCSFQVQEVQRPEEIHRQTSVPDISRPPSRSSWRAPSMH